MREVRLSNPDEFPSIGFHSFVTELYSLAFRALLVCYCTTFLLSAALLFSVQPMIGKMVLPLYGGSPAVWTTCMVFFQAVLLVGYTYAHLLSKRFTLRWQMGLHLVLITLAGLLLPIMIPVDWTPPGSRDPTPSLLALLAIAAGAPFFVVSTTAPLLQRWFAETAHPSADDPYFLYSISNIGSMAALLSYPLLIEPAMWLRQQAVWWAVAYGALVAMVALCAYLTCRHPRADAGSERRPRVGRKQHKTTETSPSRLTDAARDISARERVWWVILALVPSSWMLAFTARLTTDITPFPLLWVIPLAIYLLSFILVFSSTPPVPHQAVVRFMPMAMILLGISPIVDHAIWQLTLQLVAFFFGAMYCHGELARRRPHREHLTQFYLLMSLGGVLGGVLNAIIAPLLFPVLLEFPLVVALACLLHPGRARTDKPTMDLVALVVTFLIVVFFIRQFSQNAMQLQIVVAPTLAAASMAATICLFVLYYLRQPKMFAAVLLVVLVWELYDCLPSVRVLHRARSFFGAHQVVIDLPSIDEETAKPRPIFRRLFHGTTQHGFQDVDPARQCEPMAYFHRGGPLGRIFDALMPRALEEGDENQHIAVIGLGTGSMVCYKAPGRRFTFYEVDPVVRDIAETPAYFTYLSRCGNEYEIVLGDGRLQLDRTAQNGDYTLLILDAFSSDAIPTHLLTLEAIELYKRKLRDDGFLAFHISNKFLDLATVLGNLAPHVEMKAWVSRDVNLPLSVRQKEGRSSSTWVVMARDEKDLRGLTQQPQWMPLTAEPGVQPWTDGFSNIISILKWNPADVAAGS